MARKYENWLRAYMSHTRYSESPNNFHFWTGVATIAGALRRRVWIDEDIFQWTPNFYICLVGPPGVAAKSTSIRQGINLLKKVDGVDFGPQSMTWQALTMALEKSTVGIEIGDETKVMSCLTIDVSELGTFLNPKDTELISTLIAMWDGQQETWRRETKTSGNTTIENPWLNIIACTTPAWIKGNMPAEMIGGGFTSRMIFVFGDRKRQHVAYPSKLIKRSDWKNERDDLIHDLQEIGEMAGEYQLAPDAIIWGDAWYRALDKRPEHMRSERYDGYIARKQTHLHKIAMVFAAAKRNDLVITLEDMVEADNALTDIEKDMQKVFASIGVTQGAQIAQEVLSIIKNAKTIEYTHLWRSASQTIPIADFTSAMRGLMQAGMIKTQQNGTKKHIVYVELTEPSSAQSTGQDTDHPSAASAGYTSSAQASRSQS